MHNQARSWGALACRQKKHPELGNERTKFKLFSDYYRHCFCVELVFIVFNDTVMEMHILVPFNDRYLTEHYYSRQSIADPSPDLKAKTTVLCAKKWT